MNRRTLILLAALLLAIGFAAWQNFRPYQWGAPEAALYRIDYAEAKPDGNFWWVNLRLSRSGDQNHDFMKPTRLVTASGRELEPADTATEGTYTEAAITGMFLRFWVETGDMTGPLDLKLNDGKLSVRTGTGLPETGGAAKIHRTNNW